MSIYVDVSGNIKFFLDKIFYITFYATMIFRFFFFFGHILGLYNVGIL